MKTLGILLILLSSWNSSFAHTSSQLNDSSIVTIVLDSVRVSQSAVFHLHIEASSISDIPVSAYQFTLNFDPNHLRFDSVITTNTLSSSALIQANQPYPGVIQVATAINSHFLPSGELLHLSFMSLDQPGTTTVYFSEFLLNEGVPKVNVMPGVVHIHSSSHPDTLHLYFNEHDTFTSQQIDVPLLIDPGSTSIQSGTISVSFDPLLLNPVNIIRTQTLLDNEAILVDHFSPKEGHLNIAFAADTPITSDAEALVRILFDSTHQPGTSPLHFEQVEFNEVPGGVEFHHGSVTVSPMYLTGDANGDQTISIDDAFYIMNYVLGRVTLDPSSFQAADVSGNMRVSSYDAALVLTYLAGLIDCFPIDEFCIVNKQPGINDSNIPETLFSWRLHSSQPEMEYSESALSFNGGLHVFAIDLVIELQAPITLPNEVDLDLPDDWIGSTSHTSSKWRVSMAGNTPLPEGPLLFFKSRSTDPSLSKVQLFINDQSTPFIPDTPISSPSAALAFPYPNPFMLSSTIHFFIPMQDHVRILLYDALGRVIQTIIDAPFPSGSHSISLDTPDIPSGLYLVHLKTQNGYKDVKTLIKY